MAEAGIELALTGDPAATAPEAVFAHAPCNVVIAIDAEAEDALEGHLAPLLGDERLQLLFEESALVTARTAWDAARWSRHLVAKLLGHGDVLPAGHEDDAREAPAAPAAVPASTDIAAAAPADEGWQAFQDFDDIVALPSDRRPRDADIGFRSALTPVQDDDFDEDAAYRQVKEDLQAFAPDAPRDRWHAADTTDAPAVAQDAAARPPEAPAWSFADAPAAAEPSRAQHDMSAIEARIANFRLVEHGEAAAAPAPSAQGAIVLIGGIGGPDPLRQILQQLPAGLPVPVLVQQWLEGGQYDRLVRQMARVSALPVVLAEAGAPLVAGQVHIVPDGIGIDTATQPALFVATTSGGFADLLSGLDGSAVVAVLSGAGASSMTPVQKFLQRGGRVHAQSAEGCYDHAVPALAIAHGASAGTAQEIAASLARHWNHGISA